MSKKMYKVLCPMERNGVKWWARLGSGFTNNDESINVHMDVIPFNKPNITIQLREITEEDQRRDSERKAQYAKGGSPPYAGAASMPANDLTSGGSAPF